MKDFNNNTNVGNNTNAGNNTNDNNNTNDGTYDNTNDDTYDGKIRDIRMILKRFGNVITKNDWKKIEKEFYEIENKKNLSDKGKEKIYDRLVELLRTLDKKEKYKYHERDDLDYHGIIDIENLFDDIDDDIITNQYQSKVLLKITINIMKAEVIKTINYQWNNILTWLCHI